MEPLSRPGTGRALGVRAVAAAVSVLALVPLASIARGQSPAENGPARIFIESVVVDEGGSARSQLLLQTASSPVDRVEATLEFDPNFVGLEGFIPDSPWSNRSEAPLEPGRVELELHSSSGCGPATSCRLGELSWRGQVASTGTIAITRLELFTANSPIPSMGGDAAIQVVVPQTPEDSLGFGEGLVAVLLVGLVAAALGLPLAVFAVRARKPRWTRPRSELAGAATSDLNETLATAALGYLDAIELAGGTGQEADGFFQTLARQSSPTDKSLREKDG